MFSHVQAEVVAEQKRLKAVASALTQKPQYDSKDAQVLANNAEGNAAELGLRGHVNGEAARPGA